MCIFPQNLMNVGNGNLLWCGITNKYLSMKRTIVQHPHETKADNNFRQFDPFV